MGESFIVATENMMHEEILDGISKDVTLTVPSNIESSNSEVNNLNIMELDILFLDDTEASNMFGLNDLELFNTLPNSSTINEIILAFSEKIDNVQMQMMK